MIINADDFGYSESVNRAILQSFDEGLTSSTTLMANMPGFEEACVLAHERGLTEHVGAHLVLSEGEPLTDRIRRCRRFCDASGRFSRVGRRSFWAFWLSPFERGIVSAELQAQIERCRREGLTLTHVDSHHHIHTHPTIGPIVHQLVRQLRLPRVRLARNCGAGISLPSRLYKAYFNRRLERAGLARTSYFGVVDDYLYVKRHGAPSAVLADFEVMTHPIFDDHGGLVEGLASHLPLRDLVTKLDGHAAAVSFAGVRYA
jgi:chitin disaccharide deacetylase